MKINELELGDALEINVEMNQKAASFNARKGQALKDGVTVVEIELPTTKTVSFKDCHVEVFFSGEAAPIKWNNCTIQSIKNTYVLIAPHEGTKVNRREAYRVGLSVDGILSTQKNTTKKILMRDVSLTGFGVTDRSSELELSAGDMVAVRFTDGGYSFVLKGQVVRIEKRDVSTIYGCTIQNLPKDLPGYISFKQRAARKRR